MTGFRYKRESFVRQFWFAMLVFGAISLTSCAVVVPTATGPRALGIATTEDVDLVSGRCRRVRCYGISFRVVQGVLGVCVGLFELRTLYADQEGKGDVEPIAFHETTSGIDISSTGIMVGVSSLFGIPLPSKGSLVQEVRYSENELEQAIIRQTQITGSE